MTEKVKMFKSQRTGKVFEFEASARADENVLVEEKFDLLKRRIASGGYWVPEVGEYIYVRTSLFIDHGEDDRVGGLAEVTDVHEGMSGGDPKCLFVGTMQHPCGGSNWTQFLFREQEKLMKEHGDNFAYPDPDDRSYYDPHEWS